MTARLKALERYVACLRAQAALGPVVDDFVERWQDAQEQGAPLPDVLDLVDAANRVAVPVLVLAPVRAYLNQCARTARLPHPGRIVTAIVHGYAEANLMGLNGETCTCPARELLLKRPMPSFGGPSAVDREGPSLATRVARSPEGMGQG